MHDQDTQSDTHRPRTDQSNAGHRPWGDERGVSEVLGAVLLFGILIALLVLVQVNAVPADNQQVEFEHNQRVEGDMLALDRAILQSGMLDVAGTSEIELAARYPPRFFLLNPPVGAGTVETTGQGSLTIANAHLPSVTNYWNAGSDPKTFTTTGIRYRPNYNEYANAPETVYEHNALFNVFGPDRAVAVDPSGFIDGNQITLVTVEGQFSNAGTGGFSLETAPISGPVQTVTIDDDPSTSRPVTLTVPTTLSERHWDEVLADEPAVADYEVDETAEELTVELADGTYELRMARVGVGESAYDTSLDPRYLAPVTEPETESIRFGETKALTAQVRDRFNNPVEGTVEFTTSDPNGGFVVDGTVEDSVEVSADGDGTVEAVFSPGTSGDQTVTATVTSATDATGDATETPETVTFTVPVKSTFGPSGADSVSNINPQETVRLDFVSRSNNEVEVQFVNVGAGSPEIVEIRAMFFISNQNVPPTNFEMRNADGDTTPTIFLNGPWVNLANTDFAENTTIDDDPVVTLEFDKTINQGTLGLAITFQTSNGLVTGNYFVQFTN